MDVQTGRTLFAYNRSANQSLLKAAGELAPEELDRDLGGSFSSVKGTLRHLLWGEHSWLRFWREQSFTPDLTRHQWPDLPSIRGAWAALEKEQEVFFRDLDDAALAAPMKVDVNEYVLGELIQHTFNHSTHHRGQLVHMLRQLGRTPPDTGFRQFLTANRGRL